MPGGADVAIIGGGITGLSAALALTRRGIGAAVLEAHTIGWGASSRNGGMVLTGLKLDPATLLARYGRELARELFRASVESVDLVDQLVRTEGIDCQFRRGGHLARRVLPTIAQRPSTLHRARSGRTLRRRPQVRIEGICRWTVSLRVRSPVNGFRSRPVVS